MDNFKFEYDFEEIRNQGDRVLYPCKVMDESGAVILPSLPVMVKNKTILQLKAAHPGKVKIDGRELPAWQIEVNKIIKHRITERLKESEQPETVDIDTRLNLMGQQFSKE